ncbi:MAG: ABC transporter ATP-binding protein [Candidatus Eisenbacteria bacterium]|nr:ABC transporter ATP-binding protein [Candidatus Eisenbacteria bacterium]
MENVVLRVADARKTFGPVKALDGAALELRSGELLALLGPNGAGKTTLVRAIAGRVRLDGGTMELFGQPADSPGARDALGVVPQEIALYPHLTAGENLDAFARLHGVAGSSVRERVEWALDWTGLGDRAKEPVKRFSGGMRRRLNIACGVLHQPRVVLLDEPTVGVDPQSRERIYEMLDRLRAAGSSLLLTTHQLDEAEARCDRIVIQDHGRVVASGTLSELVEHTVGSRRHVSVTVDTLPSASVDGLEAEPGSRVLNGTVLDVGAELPGLLVRVKSAGCRVDDLQVRRPSLQSVFLHLTGRELRE